MSLCLRTPARREDLPWHRDPAGHSVAGQARLKQAGKNPDDPAVVQELYEGMFRRIGQTHPLDYYWFWTPEGWTWRR